jgi:putative membrane protein
MRKEYLVFGGLLALMLIIFAYETSTPHMHRDMEGMHEMEPWMWEMHSKMMGPSIWGLTWTFWAFLVLLVGFIYLLLREGREDALEVLKKRYARGEITREEYLRAFKDLKKK